MPDLPDTSDMLPKSQIFRVALRGDAILTSPRWNKGTAFTTAERKAFGLTGRLPHRVNTLDEQCQRAYDQLQSHENAIRKNSFLQSMKDQNWVLYYSLISRHLRELVPIIYTPTEAEAISNYSHLFRRSEGLYLTFSDKDTMEEQLLEQTQGREMDLIVCSDAEAILGIGDQGVGGIGISSAKSVIYTLIGGTDPHRSLPVMLDVGTNNEELLNDPLYVGWPHKRVRGKEYDDFMDQFVQLIRKHFPNSLLHFEDFGVTNAHKLLQRYRDEHSVFNDDIQGTGAVTLACTMAAIGVTKTKLCDQRFVIYGAGSAGLGIAEQLRDAMVSTDNVSEEEANSKFWLIDKHGLIRQSLADVREDLKKFVRSDEEWKDFAGNGKEIGLLDVVKHVKPTVLIGCSTHGGAFTKEVVQAMAEGCERPIIFPLSNPSKLVEVDPKDANDWTKGKALLATGSPFPPAKMPNGKDYVIAECNNALIYPGLGFGSMLSQSRKMTDTMIIAGARRLAALSPALEDPDASLLPDFGDAPEVNFEVAVAVAEQAIEEGVAGVKWKKEEVRERAREKIWKPVYGKYEYDEHGAN
ncbi:NAD-dependent malic enzyme, mitochondrial [Marasmius crinis-equi]|uniref:NAD-dependent malic enzyme, mitochondrial n=1 Tax=Marasmius crinis-equi TaxID=585013 RepID=A0ABR3F8W0_9AGAR